MDPDLHGLYDEIEECMRRVTGTRKGRMKIQKWHVLRAAPRLTPTTNSYQVWGWVATVILNQTHGMKDKHSGYNAWMPQPQLEQLKMAAASERAPPGRAERLTAQAVATECQNAIASWLEGYEEEREGIQLLRAESLIRLRDAKKNLFKTRGGTKALYATLALPPARGARALGRDPGAGGARGSRQQWIRQGVEWAAQAKWVRGSEVDTLFRKATAVTTKAREGLKKVNHWVLGVGEGWGGNRGAVEPMAEGVATVGLDYRGRTSLGRGKGTTRSRTHQGLTERGKVNLLRKAARKAGKSLQQFLMAFLHPDCSIWSTANYMGVITGVAHGPASLHPLNQANATKERLEHEQELMRLSELAVVEQLTALEEESDLLFALEQPLGSELWKQPAILELLERNSEAWTVHPVDQCAFGGGAKAPEGNGELPVAALRVKWDRLLRDRRVRGGPRATHRGIGNTRGTWPETRGPGGRKPGNPRSGGEGRGSQRVRGRTKSKRA